VGLKAAYTKSQKNQILIAPFMPASGESGKRRMAFHFFLVKFLFRFDRKLT
jgi:hypothetical protein